MEGNIAVCIVNKCTGQLYVQRSHNVQLNYCSEIFLLPKQRGSQYGRKFTLYSVNQYIFWPELPTLISRWSYNFMQTALKAHTNTHTLCTYQTSKTPFCILCACTRRYQQRLSVIIYVTQGKSWRQVFSSFIYKRVLFSQDTAKNVLNLWKTR